MGIVDRDAPSTHLKTRCFGACVPLDLVHAPPSPLIPRTCVSTGGRSACLTCNTGQYAAIHQARCLWHVKPSRELGRQTPPLQVRVTHVQPTWAIIMLPSRFIHRRTVTKSRGEICILIPGRPNAQTRESMLVYGRLARPACFFPPFLPNICLTRRTHI